MIQSNILRDIMTLVINDVTQCVLLLVELETPFQI